MVDLEKNKLSSLYWESDKNEEGFFVYLENFGSMRMVRATASGHHLEGMLDSKLRRASILRGSVPSCLLMDPDFAPFAPPVLETLVSDEVEGEEPSQAEDDSASVNATVASAAVGSASTGSTFTLGKHSVAYKDLPLAALKLDAILYNIFKLSIRGSKQTLLQSATFPSYVQAVIVLAKHMNISRIFRIGHAFTGLHNLVFHGDVHRFQSDFLGVKHELDTTGATITHLIMCQLMKSSRGSPRQYSSRSQRTSTRWMLVILTSISTTWCKAIVQILLQ